MVLEPSSESDSITDQSTSPSTNVELPDLPNKSFNRQIALVSALAAVGLFLSGRLDFGVSLKDLTAAALPYEEVCLLMIVSKGEKKEKERRKRWGS